MDKEEEIPTEVKKNISQSSVEPKKNAKGEHQWDIKVYDEDVKIAMEKSELVDKHFEEKYGSGQ
jgi:hypothetical protein